MSLSWYRNTAAVINQAFTNRRVRDRLAPISLRQEKFSLRSSFREEAAKPGTVYAAHDRIRGFTESRS